MSIWRMPTVKVETGHRSHASIYTAIKNGTFPQPVRIGQRSVGWPSAEIQAICTARVAGATSDQLKELVNQLHEKRKTDFAALGFCSGVGGATV